MARHLWSAAPGPAPAAPDRPASLQAKLATLVAAEPGISVAELQARTQCGWGAMYRALEPLVATGAVVQARVGRRALLYPRNGGLAPSLSTPQATIKGRTRQRMARLLASAGGVTASELRDATATPERTVYYHLAKLEEAGLVQGAAQVRGRVFFPTTLLVQLLEASRPAS